MKFQMAAEIRTQTGKGAARQLRRQGHIPAVLYGQGECTLLTVEPKQLAPIMASHAAGTSLVSLRIGGGAGKAERTALLRDYQRDPVTGEVLHIDLFEVSMDKAIRVKVPVSLVGGAPEGVKEGGVLHHNLRELHIECLPGTMPDSIEVDASALKIGQGIHVRELAARQGVRYLDEGDMMVVSVAAPMSEAKLEALLTTGVPVEAKEPEVIGKGKEEAKEGVEPAAEAKGEKKEAKEAPKEEKKK